MARVKPLTAVQRRALGLATEDPGVLWVSGRRVLLDPEDLEWASTFTNWLIGKSYVERTVWRQGRGPRTYRLHRLILGLTSGDGLEVDHINRDKLDNRRENLRVVTRAQNMQNVPGGYGRSGVRGVDWVSRRKMWRGRVKSNGREYSKCFPTIEEAAQWASDKRAEVLPYSQDALGRKEAA